MKKTIVAAMIIMFLTLTSFASVAKCDCECDEFFYDVYTIVWDEDGDGCDDHVEVVMDVDTCEGACVDVHVDAVLWGPDSAVYDSAMPDWTTCGDDRDERSVVLAVPPGAPTGWYDLELILYDECGEEDYRLWEDALYNCGPSPTIETCDNTAGLKDEFNLGGDVYVVGDSYPTTTPTTYNVYVVVDVDWTDGMPIPGRVPGTVESLSVDASGNINPSPTLIWSGSTLGKYDIIVDVNDDGHYNMDGDALDDRDIEVTAGFFVIPDLLGTIMGLAGFFTALAVFRLSKRKHP